MMKKIALCMIICCQVLWVAAQTKAPKWMDKERKAVVSIATFDKDNKQIGSGTGFFINESGDILSAYSLFKNAAKATVTDADGKAYDVTHIIGADELYDAIKVKVSVPKKVAFLPMATEPLANGTTVYLLPYSTGKISKFGQGTVTEVSKLKDPFNYYKTSIPMETGWQNAPVLTENGEVFGLAQEDASGKKENSYAVSAGYANSLAMSSADVFNTVYSTIKIRKAWPTDVEQAQVALFLKSSTENPQTYLETLNDFIATFPNSSEGYLNRASHYAYHRTELASDAAGQAQLLNKALEDMDAAARFANKKSDVLYNHAKLIYGIAATDTTIADEKWSMQAALETIGKAIQEDNSPVNHQLQGDIYFFMEDYEKAFDDYMIINNSEFATPATWYWASKAKAQIPGSNFGEMIALLDSAINRCGTPPTAEAAPYILERTELKLKLMNYADAIADYNLYYDIMNGRVNDSFYYYREQAKFRSNDLEGALADIQKAIQISPDDPNYLAEEASVYMRMEKYTEALASIDKALTLAPDFAACYRLRGVCFVRQKKSAEACESLRKAKELGDPLAERLIKEHCK